ncbi:MAG: filamentous hemagglutinin N-terminal domain-containing protein [Verrucomicrobiales bacterium]|nr:filamentous hemagglutinin N-terminal domain-containing protein [Verrucomicrobiales bacterium]
MSFSLASFGNPNGLTVSAGTATVAGAGPNLTITASHNAVLNWQSFNVGAGESARFIQPSASSIAWNQIQDSNPSQIFGRIEANGVIVLMNQAGFYFGPGSFVGAAGLTLSTAPVVPVESGSGLFWQFNGAPPQAGIINHGRIQVGEGGSVFLISQRIENRGEIVAPSGMIGLLAGNEVLISDRPDGRGLSAKVNLPSGLVDNSGHLVADAGTIALHAQVVNQGGVVQANAVHERNGIIEFVASDSATLGGGSIVSARGDTESPSSGGMVRIQSGGSFSDAPGSRIEVGGGAAGGDGGRVEISATRLSRIHSTIDASAGAGGVGGRLRIDPVDIVLGNGGSGHAEGGLVGPKDPPDTLELDVNSVFVGFSEIVLQATRNITVTAGTLWDLEASTGVSSAGSHLKLEAGNNLTIANGAGILAGENWSVTLEAGRDFAQADAVVSGQGSIAFQGSGHLQVRNGDARLIAGNQVSVANGFVRSVAGGSIEVSAVAGSIQTGTRANGFLFRPGGYGVDPGLGGISTADGGDVSLTAGLDVISYLPVAGGIQSDAGSGAFGEAPGNVTVTAGRDVAGHFVVRNGDGAISAQRNAGTSTRLLALSLVEGGWSVKAGQDVLLQEVRNPNGLFNNLGSSASPSRQFFDYSDDASVRLEAGNSVQLRGTALPRYLNAFSQGMPPIYPGRLEIEAGEGGVVLGNDVILFPSPIGGLRVATTDGGSMIGTKPGDLVQLVLSDSDKRRYREFGDFGIGDHGSTPVHKNDTEPVGLDIAGDLSGVLIGAAKRAEIRVGGDMINSRFEGQNLHADDVTRIEVVGDVRNQSEFTQVTLETAPNLGLFDLVYPPLTGALAGLQSQISYDPVGKTVTFQGRMSGDQLAALLRLPVQKFDANGLPLFAPNGEPLTEDVAVLPAEVANQLYAQSQDIPLNPDTGYRLGGGGRFEFSARDLDLGATAGIISYGPRANPALAKDFLRGADVRITLAGDLTMFSTAIASLNGGDIEVFAQGSATLGSRQFQGNDSVARGIFTVDPSDVTVVARGNIEVSGSRIAAYDGGNVLVRSLEGDVNAGTGGNGAATVEKIVVDPVTRAVLSYAPTIPGSGILATTFPRSLDPAFPASQNTVGNIVVDAPRGDIVASAGGVVQIPLNGVGANAGTVTLTAGTRDASGQVVYVGNIDASGSGVIGGTVKLEASGDIKGLVFARENIELSAQRSVNVTALAQGGVNVSAGGNVSGTIIGVGSVSASGGGTVDAALLSQNISANGNVTSSQVGFSQGSAANATSQGVSSEEPVETAAASKKSEDEDDLKRRTAVAPRLVRTTGRVTVILPETAPRK